MKGVSLAFNLLYLSFCPIILATSPGLTVVGKVNTTQGIGRIATSIIASVCDKMSVNFINTRIAETNMNDLADPIKKIVTAPYKGHKAISVFTDVLWNGPKDYNFKKVPGSEIKFAYSMLESTEIPPEWVTILNNKFDGVLVPHEFLIHVYRSSGVRTPLFVLPLPLEDIDSHQKNFNKRILNAIKSDNKPVLDDLVRKFGKKILYLLEDSTNMLEVIAKLNKSHLVPDLKNDNAALQFNEGRPFIFGCIANFGQRKNQQLLVRAFAQAFGNSPNYKLILHSQLFFNNEYEHVQNLVKELGLKNVDMSNTVLPYEKYLDLIRSFDCFVLISKGEGYSFTPREALYLQVPCIISDNTAHQEIATLPSVISIPNTHIEPAFYESIQNRYIGYQYNCNEEDVVQALKHMYDNYYSYVKKTNIGHNWAKQFNLENLKNTYLNLFKPKIISLSHKNSIDENVLSLDSKPLYEKYCQVYPYLRNQIVVRKGSSK